MLAPEPFRTLQVIARLAEHPFQTLLAVVALNVIATMTMVAVTIRKMRSAPPIPRPATDKETT